MANFFSDNKDLQFHLQHPMMRKIVELKERGFAEKDLYDFAPQDFEDAMDSYRRVLEIAGEVCGEVIAPNAEGVDHEGPRVVNDHVEYAAGTVQNMKAIVDAGLSGLTLPRKYDGLNFPLVCFVMANEMVARADAGFENIWGLQDCAETLNEFASEELKAKYLPWVSAGATCAMDLTEPDAGSDLGAVMLKATWSEEKQTWLLNGVKRFITNGDGDVSLVLARTEEGTTDARGLSMLVYDKRDGGVKVRRIENKMGIKGSPTCELVFTNAPAQLVGDRKMGLIKYVMSLMNAARLGIGAQSVGLCEAAYREALKYAQEREQFGKPIIRFAAVAEMLSNMKAKLQGVRALLYETARFVEVYKQYMPHLARTFARSRGAPGDEVLQPPGRRLHAAGEALLVGVRQPAGLRRHPDPRRLGLHEGLSVRAPLPRRPHHEHLRGNLAAAGRGGDQCRDQGHVPRADRALRRRRIFSQPMQPVVAKAEGAGPRSSREMTAHVEAGDKELCGFKDFHARRLVETAGHIIITYLLARQAGESEEYADSAKIFCKLAEGKISEAYTYVMNSTLEDVALFRAGE